MLYTLTIGLNDKDTKKEMDFDKANEVIENIALRNIGYSSTYLINGTYTHNNGIKIHEKSIKVEFLGTEKDKEKIIKIATEIKQELNQESVLYQELLNNINYI